MRVSSARALNASRKAGNVAASRRDNAGWPAGVRRGESLSHANPAPAMAAIDRRATAVVTRALLRLTAG